MKAREATQGVIFRDDITLIPGNCDVSECPHSASYSFNNLYLCADCLITACADGTVPAGTFVCRVAPPMEMYL